MRLVDAEAWSPTLSAVVSRPPRSRTTDACGACGTAIGAEEEGCPQEKMSVSESRGAAHRRRMAPRSVRHSTLVTGAPAQIAPRWLGAPLLECLRESAGDHPGGAVRTTVSVTTTSGQSVSASSMQYIGAPGAPLSGQPQPTLPPVPPAEGTRVKHVLCGSEGGATGWKLRVFRAGGRAAVGGRGQRLAAVGCYHQLEQAFAVRTCPVVAGVGGERGERGGGRRRTVAGLRGVAAGGLAVLSPGSV